MIIFDKSIIDSLTTEQIILIKKDIQAITDNKHAELKKLNLIFDFEDWRRKDFIIFDWNDKKNFETRRFLFCDDNGKVEEVFFEPFTPYNYFCDYASFANGDSCVGYKDMIYKKNWQKIIEEADDQDPNNLITDILPTCIYLDPAVFFNKIGITAEHFLNLIELYHNYKDSLEYLTDILLKRKLTTLDKNEINKIIEPVNLQDLTTVIKKIINNNNNPLNSIYYKLLDLVNNNNDLILTLPCIKVIKGLKHTTEEGKYKIIAALLNGYADDKTKSKRKKGKKDLWTTEQINRGISYYKNRK